MKCCKKSIFYSCVKNWLIGLIELPCELFLFIFNLPIYIKRFLEGLRILSRTYDEITKGLRDRKEELARKAYGNMADEPFMRLSNKILEIENAQEKMFNQLFGIFIATLALVISIRTLIINLTKK